MTKFCPQSLSCVWCFATPWTVARQAPLSMGFSRQAYWSGLPLPSPGDKTRKYVRFSLRDVDCTPVQPWSGTLHALSSLMSLFDMLVFSKEDLLPCKTGDASLFPLCDHGSWLLPVPMATVHTSSQDRLILFLSVEEDCLKQGHFIYKINCNIGWSFGGKKKKQLPSRLFSIVADESLGAWPRYSQRHPYIHQKLNK